MIVPRPALAATILLLAGAVAPAVAQEAPPDTVASADTTPVPGIRLRILVDSVPLRIRAAVRPGGVLGLRLSGGYVAAVWERAVE